MNAIGPIIAKYRKEQAKSIKENLRKAKALVKAGIAKEIVAKIMGE